MAIKSGVTLHKRSAVANKVPLTTDLEMGQLGINTFDGKAYLKVNDGVENVKQIGHDRMRFMGKWAETGYVKSDVVVDGQWTMVANKPTTDKAAPVPIGGPIWSTDPELIPTQGEFSDVVSVLHEYVMNTGGWIQSVQVRMPNWTPSTTTTKISITTESGTSVVANPILSDDGSWADIFLGNTVAATGSSLSIKFEAFHQLDANTISGGWESNIGGGVPANQGFNLTSPTADGTLTIDHTDLDGGERTSELRGVSPGSIISLVETSAPARSSTFRTIGIDQTPTLEYSTYSVEYIDQGSQSALRSGRTTTVTIDVPITSDTDYHIFEDGTLSPPSWGALSTSLSYGGVLQPDVADSYGINVLFQAGLASPDWDFLASSAAGTGSGGGTPGDGVGEAPTDGTPYARQDSTWVSTVTQDQIADIGTALQPGLVDNVSELINDATYIPDSPAGSSSYTRRFNAWNSRYYAGGAMHLQGERFYTNSDAGGYITSNVDGDVVLSSQGTEKIKVLHNSTAAYSLPNVSGTANQVLTTDGAGSANWVTPAAAGVSSVDGRTGVVTLTDLYAPLVHTHVKSEIVDFSDGDYATSAQGLLADSALQPGDNISELVNDLDFVEDAPSDGLSRTRKDGAWDTSYIAGGPVVMQGQNFYTNSPSGGYITSDVDGDLILNAVSPNRVGIARNGNLSYQFPNIAGTEGQVIAASSTSSTNWVTPVTALGDLSDVTLPPATDLGDGQRLSYDGSTEQWTASYSTSALGIVSFPYRIRIPLDTTPPNRYLSGNNDDVTLIDILYINPIDDALEDISLFIEKMTQGDWLNVYLRTDTEIYQAYDVTGPSVLNGNGIWEVPVVYFASGLVNVPEDGDRVRLYWRRVSQENAVPDAPVDGVLYGRQDAAWVPVPTELTALTDVDSAGATDGQRLTWSDLSQTWVPGDPVDVPLESFTFYADMMQSPATSGWAIPTFATLTPDTFDDSLMIRAFDDTVTEGVGFMLQIPEDAVSYVFSVTGRCPSASGNVVFRIYRKGVPDRAPIEDWGTMASSMIFSNRGLTEEFSASINSRTLAAAGMVPGNMTNFEVTRIPANGSDTMVGDFHMLSCKMEFFR